MPSLDLYLIYDKILLVFAGRCEKMNTQNAIEVRNMSKQFKVNYEKAHTLKEKILFWQKGHTEIHEVLKNINLNIKKEKKLGIKEKSLIKKVVRKIKKW